MGGKSVKDKIIDLLKSTEREGIDNLIEAMEQGGFFEAPCSTDKHLCYPGGLAEHSLNVYSAMVDIDAGLAADLPEDSIVICAILHDLGKMGDHGKPNYTENILKSGLKSSAKPYSTNKDLIYLPHEIRSAMIAERYIKLSEDEETAILFHNGLYSTFKNIIPGHEFPLYLILHTADMYVSRFLEEKDGKVESD